MRRRLAWRSAAGACCAWLNQASTVPAVRRRLWVETGDSLGLVETVAMVRCHLDGDFQILVVALSEAGQLHCRARLPVWGDTVRVAGPDAWAGMTGHAVWHRAGGVLGPRRSFRKRSQCNLVRGGYAALAVLAAGGPAELYAVLAPRPPVWLPMVLWLLLVWLLVRLAHAGGRRLAGSPLDRALGLLDVGLAPQHRLMYWLGFLVCALGTFGLSIAVLLLGLWCAGDGDAEPTSTT